MELRNDNRPLDPKRPDLARSARQGIERAIESMDRSQAAQERQLQAARERVRRVRAAQAAHVREVRDAGIERREEIADRVDLSETAHLLAGDEEEGEARAALVSSLEAAYRDGNLNTRERVERAAQRLLGDE